MALTRHLGKRNLMSASVKKPCVFGPNSGFRTYWDSMSMLCIIYVMVFTPVQVAFMAQPLMETSIALAHTWGTDGGCDQGAVPCFNYWGIFVMDLFIDLFFTADIIINFRTSWVDTDPYSPTFKSQQHTCKDATINYMKGMFFIDVVSVLPFWILDLNPELAGQGTLLRVPRLLRLAKLTKLLRVLRASRVYNRWHKMIVTNSSAQIVMLIELTVVMLASVHLMGCVWYLIADMQLGFEQEYVDKFGPPDKTTSTTTPNITATLGYEGAPEWWEGNSWIMRVQGYQRDSIWEMYLASIYFALMTITTIGYGDVVPVIFTERVLALFCMLIGVLIFSYVVGQVALLIRVVTARRNRFFEDMTTLQAYLNSYPFGKVMRLRAIDYFYYTYNKKQYHFDNESRKTTIAHFSPFLGRSLAYTELKHFLIGRDNVINESLLETAIHNTALSAPDPLPFLDGASQHIIKDLCTVLDSEVHGPIEMIAYQGGPCNKMFTLDHGCGCQWRCRYRRFQEPSLQSWRYMEKGHRFGTDSLLLAMDPLKLRAATAYTSVWYQSVQTLTFCDFVCLSAEAFARTMYRYPKQVRKMRPAILRAKLRMFFRSLPKLDPKVMERVIASAKQAVLSSSKDTVTTLVGSNSEQSTEMLKRMINLREENSTLKTIVEDIQKQLSTQRVEFNEAIKEQQQRMGKAMKDQQETLAEQRQAMEEQRQAMTQQHQELLALLKAPK